MTKKILAITTNSDIEIVLDRLINEHWTGTVVDSFDNCLNKLKSETYSVLLLGSGLEEKEELQLEEFVNANSPSTKVVRHYGGGSGLLSAEINGALQD